MNRKLLSLRAQGTARAAKAAVDQSLPFYPQRLAKNLGLEPHPEGGYFRQVPLSKDELVVSVRTGETRPARSLIDFVMTRKGKTSAWHRVDTEETWHHYKGAPVALFLYDPKTKALRKEWLGAGHKQQVCVPAGWWQAAATTGRYSWVGCSVAPAFEYADWTLMADKPEVAHELADRFPEVAWLIVPRKP